MIDQAPAQAVFGTAGHVDHGKTRLVQALTGADTDRLPEEQRRGLTIELGFAFLPGAAHGQAQDLAFVDCPGHERFIRQAISGIAGMAGAILVVDAVDGWAAQTLEHLELLRLLGVPWGQVVLTRADRADDAAIEQTLAQGLEHCQGSVFAERPPLITSALSGRGIDELRELLFQAAAALNTADRRGEPRLAIDRCFTIDGVGTVVTGTLQGGPLERGDTVSCRPGPQASVRGLEVAGQAVNRALPGQRTACNLGRLDGAPPERGSWLGRNGQLQGTNCADIWCQASGTGPVHGREIQVHHGSGRWRARLSLMDEERCEDQGPGQLRFLEPCPLWVGARVLIREISPPRTVAAATILGIDSPKHRRKRLDTQAWFAALRAGGGQTLVAQLDRNGRQAMAREAAARLFPNPGDLTSAIDEAGPAVVAVDDLLWSQRVRQHLMDTVVKRLYAKGNDLDPWLPVEQLRQQLAPRCAEAAWRQLIEAIEPADSCLVSGSRCAAPAALTGPPDTVLSSLTTLLSIYREAGLRPPFTRNTLAAQVEPEQAAQAMVFAQARGWLIPISDRQVVAREPLEGLLASLCERFAQGLAVDVQWFKQEHGLTRKHAVPIAEWCDRQGLTLRQDNIRTAGPRLKGADPSLPIPLLQALPPD